ncbi:hypothetical protein [Clostridium sp. AM58-1XD]|uniref:hypothetical protein n=1 Tax=Clostridium sp. AM58-1XD TaxID=2292307 RepID=UPI001FA8D337|nr:hypothetical protein [Clostridium sp. AM58-1XD]
MIHLKWLHRKWKRLYKEYKNIHLVDRFLIIFMAILLIQSAYTLIIQPAATARLNEIDVIVRTSAASIFGYFLSANFIRRDSHPPDVNGESLETAQMDEYPSIGNHVSEGNSLQITAAAAVGLFCLLTLILLRDTRALETASPYASSTITQFRDFVSGCVGFLIGCPTSAKNDERR